MFRKYLKIFTDGVLANTWTFSNAEYLGDRARRWGFIGEGSEAANENGGRNSLSNKDYDCYRNTLTYIDYMRGI